MSPRPVVMCALVAAGLAGLALAQEPPQLAREVGGELRTPVAVAFLPDGSLAVADDAAATVTLFEPDGRPRWATGEGLQHPAGLYADERGLWVADAGERAVLQLDPDSGALVERTDLGPDIHPSDLVVTRHGTLWVSASTDDVLLLLDPVKHSMLVVDNVAGEPMDAPRGLAPDGHGGVWVVESLTGGIHRFSATGELVASPGGWGIGAGRFAKPKDLCALPDGGLLVLDAQLGLVQRLDADGRFVAVLARDSEPLRLDHPLGIAAAGDRVAVAEAGAHRVVLLDATDATARFPEPASLVAYSSIRDMDPGLVCRQCHDGTRRQSPGIWDPGVHNHPLEPAEGTVLPDDVERTKEGALTCFSCHAIHRPDADGAADADSDPDELDPESIVMECGHCHEDLDRRATSPTGNAHPVGKSLPYRADREALARITVVQDDKVACRTCHRPHGATEDHLLVGSTDDATLCLTCHHGQADLRSGHPMDVRPDGAVRAKILAEGGTLRDDGSMSCLTCHAAHDGRGDPLLRMGASPLASCQRCHPDKVDQLADSPHHEKVCTDCHGTHTHNEVTDADCGECHEDEWAAQQRGGHGDAVCRDCHSVHGDPPADTALAATLDVNPFASECLACHHPDARPDMERAVPRVAHYEHPVDVFTPDGDAWISLGGMPLYGPDGEPLPPGQQGEVTCGTCHLTHGPAAAHKRPQMRRSEWKETCAMCHGPGALSYYQYFHYPENR